MYNVSLEVGKIYRIENGYIEASENSLEIEFGMKTVFLVLEYTEEFSTQKNKFYWRKFLALFKEGIAVVSIQKVANSYEEIV